MASSRPSPPHTRSARCRQGTRMLWTGLQMPSGLRVASPPLPSPGPPAWPLQPGPSPCIMGHCVPCGVKSPKGTRLRSEVLSVSCSFSAPFDRIAEINFNVDADEDSVSAPARCLLGVDWGHAYGWAAGRGADPWVPCGTRGLGRSPARLCLRPAAATTFSPLMTRRTMTSGRTRRPTAPPG